MINGQEEYRLDYSSNAFSPPMSFSLGFSFFFFGYYVFVLFFVYPSGILTATMYFLIIVRLPLLVHHQLPQYNLKYVFSILYSFPAPRLSKRLGAPLAHLSTSLSAPRYYHDLQLSSHEYFRPQRVK